MNYLKKIVLPFFLTAFLMALFQVGKYFLLKGEYTIWQSHIMTILFTSLISTIVSLSMINWMERIEKRKMELELQVARLQTLRATMHTVHHIVNNFLNSLLLIRFEIEGTGKLSKITLEKIEAEITDISEKLIKLGEIEDPEDSAAFSKFFPPKKLPTNSP